MHPLITTSMPTWKTFVRKLEWEISIELLKDTSHSLLSRSTNKIVSEFSLFRCCSPIPASHVFQEYHCTPVWCFWITHACILPYNNNPPVCEGAWPWFQWVKQDVNYFAVLRYEHSICLKEQYLSSGRNVKTILKNIKILCICHIKFLADSYKEQEML